MAEGFDLGIRGTFQNEQRNYTFRREGKKNNLRRLSSVMDIHNLGRLVSSLDLRISAFREDEIKNANRLFDEKSGMLNRKLDNNSADSRFTTSDCKYNVFKRDSKRNSCEVHDGCFSSLRNTNEHQGGSIESTKNADVGSGIRCEECPFQKSIRILQAQFRKLFRIGALGSNVWTTDTTDGNPSGNPSGTCRLTHAHSFPTQGSSTVEGNPSGTCRLIHAHPFPTQGSSTVEDKGTVSKVPACAVQNGNKLCYNNNSILVDAFDKSSRSHVGTFVGFGILKDSGSKELTSYIKELTSYIASVSKFGFNHIIIIGEIYSGIVFLDCYGRVFVWEDEDQMVFPLGDSLEEASKRSIGGDELAWFVRNGNVYEYIKKPQP